MSANGRLYGMDWVHLTAERHGINCEKMEMHTSLVWTQDRGYVKGMCVDVRIILKRIRYGE
jgi:hypothetical protein